MKTKVRSIGNSLGVILPQEINLKKGEELTVYQVDDTIILKPVHANVFEDTAKWDGFYSTLTEEEKEWEEDQ
ncbi:AbrB/MazE/SpoVT family DNA-binding domain-containing protein [Listeria fleischmannii]|uniref:Antitoxin MazE n=1 Tax=Listeria fleischmannii TaxID=1069827 RepID=A0A841YIP3_9LIST|nr:AbrB/MazE/SpoVT family DNA-binding domain-containing protein [Listeria fleischmannii]MBC1399908.1 antitoxin MazE [Listeria fleischmannii]